MSENKKATGFSAEERAAMKERAKELKTAATRAESEKDVLAKIAEMGDADRAMATRLHEIIAAEAPELYAKTWYGMPAYYRDGKVIVFFQAGSKFKTRYATVGFGEDAQLDDGNFWPNAYAITKLTKTEEKLITALLKRAAG